MKNKFLEFLGKAEVFTKAKSPVILSGLAIVGVLSTAYAAYKAGPRAAKILEAYKKEMEYVKPGDVEAKKVVVSETAKKLVPVAAPPIIMGGMTIACIVGSHSVSSRRIAALSAAYTLSESTVKNLNNKMEEMLGEKKTRAIKDSIMKDKLDKDNGGRSPEEGQIIMTGNGDVLCKDLYSGRFFKSNAQKIGEAINRLSADVITDMYVSLNDFYYLLGLEQIPMGDDLGWNVDDSIRGKLPITFTALLTTDNQPCLCVDYDVSVRADFRSLH